MKFKIFIFWISLFVVQGVLAAPISDSEALKIGKNFIEQHKTFTRQAVVESDLRLIFVGKENTNLRSRKTSSQNYYYVFNVGENKGFVIVAGDTRVKKILAYSPVGKFSADRMPDNLKTWLNNYSAEIKFAIENLPESYTEPDKTSTQIATRATTAAPLLGEITYDQDAPYNLLCPKIGSTPTYTGCVATAMAQVMRYYQWPDQGVGSKTYTSPSINQTLTADFGSTTYDWANMLPYYYLSTTTAQQNAIATLMYHAGVSVEMDYNTTGSGAITRKAVFALHNYFKYDAGIQYYDRKYFNESAWIQKLKSEIDADRPVLYEGATSNSEGHAFVCDGYDSNDFFHMNWGWSGLSNGYYELSALTPVSQGIGGNNSGYNYYQGIIAGIKPSVSGSVITQTLGIDSIGTSVTSIPRNGNVDLTLYNLTNIGGFDYEGNVGFVLSKVGQSDILIVQGAISLPVGTYAPSATISDINFDNQISAGEYLLKAVFTNETSNYVPITPSNAGFNFLNVTITSTDIFFTKPAVAPALQITVQPSSAENLYTNKVAKFNVSIINSGTAEYNGQFGIKLVNTNDPNISYNLSSSIGQLAVGESTTFEFYEQLTALPGNYYVEVYYDLLNNPENTGFPVNKLTLDGAAPTVTVNAEPTASVLSVVSVNMPSTVFVSEKFTLSSSIRNTGGFYDGQLVAIVFDPNNGNSYVTRFGDVRPLIDMNVTENVDFVGEISGIPYGDYIVALFNGNTQLTNGLPFTLQPSSSTKIDENSFGELKVLNNPVKDILEVMVPPEIKVIYLFDSQGKLVKTMEVNETEIIREPVYNLPGGLYILKGVDNAGKQYIVKVLK